MTMALLSFFLLLFLCVLVAPTVGSLDTYYQSKIENENEYEYENEDEDEIGRGKYNKEMERERERERGEEGLSCEFAVHLSEATDPILFANNLGLQYIKPIGSLEGHYLFRARDHDHACNVHSQLTHGMKAKREAINQQTETGSLSETETTETTETKTKQDEDKEKQQERERERERENTEGVEWFERQVFRWRHPRSFIYNPDEYLTLEPTITNPIEYLNENKHNSRPHNKKQDNNNDNNKNKRSSYSYPPVNNATTWLPSDPLFSEQWNLLNTDQIPANGKGIDMNVVPAWQLASGLGIRVAIVDDGIQHNHADLKERYSADTSFNFNDNNNNLLPKKADTHGTMCAGAVAAAANTECGVGVAFRAHVSALRILGGPSSDAMEADALSFKYHRNHIFSNSWGPTDDGRTLEGPGPLTTVAIEKGVKLGRNGLGAIYVWAAGNGAKKGDNCNYDGYASSRYVLTVGSVDYLGHHPFYSELCAAILISAPSSGKDNDGIITDNIELGCTSKFTGTSAAAPLVAGVVALILEVNPQLTWRDVQHILVNSAQLNDIEDHDWVENGAGRLVNHKYGYGIVDAYASVMLAKQWTNVAPQISIESPLQIVNKIIPDNEHNQGIKSEIQITENIILERAEVVFTAKHPYRTDLRVVLVSPSGTPSYLSEMHGHTQNFMLKLSYSANETFHVLPLKAAFGPTPISWLAQYVKAPLVLTEPASACAPLKNIDEIRGSVAAIAFDDECAWNIKIKNAQDAGALGAIVIFTKGRPVEMTGYDSSIVIPALMIGDKEAVRAWDAFSRGTKVTALLSTSIAKKDNLQHYDKWVFTTVHVWDEASKGTWTLQVYDKHATGEGEFNSWQLRLHGTPFHNVTKYNAYRSPSSPSVSPSLSPSPSSFFARIFDNYNFMFVILVVALSALSVFGWHHINRGKPNQVEETGQVV